jgi:phage shock protein C
MRRLYKSRSDRVIYGVCGGIGEYLAVDPVLIRIAWIILTMLGGGGIIAYIIGIIIIPDNQEKPSFPKDSSQKQRSNSIWGGILIIVGFLFLFSRMDIVGNVMTGILRVHWETLLGVFIILLGIYLLFRPSSEKVISQIKGARESSPFGSRRLYKSKTDQKFLGVCAGIGDYFNIDPTIIRFLWVILTLASVGLGIILYFVLAIFLPELEENQSTTE